MSELTNKLKSSLTFSFVDKYIGYLLRFVSTIVVARFLSPEEVGIYSVAFVVISLGHVLRDFGVAQYLIQEKSLTTEKIKAAFGLMFCIAWSLWLVLFIFKHQFSAFYDEPRLSEALAVLTIIFLLAPFGSVRIALLRREMQFKTLAKINVFSYLSLFTATLLLCYLGFSYMALVWGQLAGVVATILGCVLACGKQHWYIPSLKGVRQVLGFGLNITAANIAENTAEGAPDLFIGKILDMQSVGLFSRAQGCVSLFKVFVSASVWPVILPYFSMKNRQDGDMLPDYLRAIEIYTAFAWPFFMSVMILAQPLVLLLYGSQWVASIPLVQVLSLAAVFEACFPFRNALLVAMGNTKLNLKMQLVVSGFRVAAICIGCLYGLWFAAAGLAVAEAISQSYVFYGLRKVVDIRWRSWFGHIQVSIFLSIVLSLSAYSMLWCKQLWLWSNWQTILLSGLVGFALWTMVLYVSGHPIAEQISMILRKVKLKSPKIKESSL